MLNELILSVAGVALTVLVAWALMRRVPKPTFDAARAIEVAEQALAGFIAEAAVVDPVARAAVVRGRGGLAVLKPMGDDWAVRAIGADAIRRVGGALVIDSGEPMFGSVTLAPGDVDAAFGTLATVR